MSKPRFLVAEVSKNWLRNAPEPDLLSQRFERCCNVNDDRGYDLHSWKLERVVGGNILNETIIAVFERREAT